MLERAGERDKARLQAAAASKVGSWLEAPSNKNLDLRFTNAEIVSRVGRRLGVELVRSSHVRFVLV